jgi:hypothetical protein
MKPEIEKIGLKDTLRKKKNCLRIQPCVCPTTEAKRIFFKRKRPKKRHSVRKVRLSLEDGMFLKASRSGMKISSGEWFLHGKTGYPDSLTDLHNAANLVQPIH